MGWQDAASVVILVLLAWNDPYVSPWYIPVAFLFAYSVMMCSVPICACEYGFLGILGGSVIIGFFVWRFPVVLFLLALVTVAMLHPRIQRAATRLYLGHPDDLPDHGLAREWRRHLNGLPARDQRLDYYPYNMIREPVSRFRFSIKLALLISCGASLFFYAISIDPRTVEGDVDLYPWGGAVILTVIPVFRWLFFGLGRRAPLSLRGRFVHRHWIIPQYDQIFVAPLTVFAIGESAYWLGLARGLEPPAAFCTAMAAALYLSLRMLPHLDEWIYTGGYQYGRMYQFSLGGKRI